MTTTLFLVSCGQQKAATAAPAGQLYTSQLFRASARYAQANGDAWLILSAKHGLVDPDTELEPYDQRLAGGQDARRAWSGRIQAGMARWLLDNPHLVDRGQVTGLRIVVLAGRDYFDALPDWIQDLAEQPLAGRQIGQRLQWLARANATESQTTLF